MVSASEPDVAFVDDVVSVTVLDAKLIGVSVDDVVSTTLVVMVLVCAAADDVVSDSE